MGWKIVVDDKEVSSDTCEWFDWWIKPSSRVCKYWPGLSKCQEKTCPLRAQEAKDDNM
jgi:hypothetical protein